MNKKTILDSVADEIEDGKLNDNEQILHLRNKNKLLENENNELKRVIGEQREFNEMVVSSVMSSDSFPKFKYKNVSKKNTPIIPVIVFSDWHIGEVINENETEGFGKFNYAIAEKRIYKIIEDFLQWVEIQRSFYYIDECVIFCEGDYISGDIHQELVTTNEFPLPVQTAKAGLLLGQVFRLISPHFDRVTVYEVGADNHGRLQKKPQAKQKSSNNMSYLVHIIANVYSEKCKNLKFVIADGVKLLANVNGLKFLIEHGDTVRGWSGIPQYGFNRMIGKESKRRMNTDKGFHIWSIGHFHVPNFIDEQIMVNGSLNGTSEFDHVCGRHAKPSQIAFLVHPKYGVFNWTRFLGDILP